MKKNFEILLCACLIGFGSISIGYGVDDEILALENAKIWMEMVDNGKYSESWEDAATYFKAAVKKEEWEESIKNIRESMGKVLSRNLISQTYATELPGAPDGEYYVIQFQTSFSKKKNSVETITPTKDKDGIWRMSGYFIR